ncbi:hypothetical protein LSM04_004983 [Trypanosoma melophagium]|uniref:uncharacterized protein n=1 Tax=Trypanosoma melophagium TaxID=715481 RepID=UPI00351A42E0|nr:hypothetical protein LSM04_004983 [Trypanosoma melophagium]
MSMQQDANVCTNPNSVPGENYAVMGGLLGGIACTVLYIVIVRAADVCYRRQHTNNTERPVFNPDWETQHRCGGSAGVVHPTPRRVRFEANSVERVESPSLALQQQQSQAQYQYQYQSQEKQPQEQGGNVNGNSGGEKQQGLYSRGMAFETLSSPPPSLPPRR